MRRCHPASNLSQSSPHGLRQGRQLWPTIRSLFSHHLLDARNVPLHDRHATLGHFSATAGGSALCCPAWVLLLHTDQSAAQPAGTGPYKSHVRVALADWYNQSPAQIDQSDRYLQLVADADRDTDQKD